uniref:Uncharacterized protein n=1 Tax=Lepeophtheirus salmonis TaxID=72036 RepID=A0A0K2UQE7_LEPSM
MSSVQVPTTVNK